MIARQWGELVKRANVAILIFAISGSATAQPKEGDVRIVDEPTIGSTRTVVAGNPISEHSTFVLSRASVFIPSEQIVPAEQRPDPLVIQRDARMISVETRSSFKACVADGTGGPCALDDDADGDFDRISRNQIGRAVPVATPVRYRSEELVTPIPAGVRQVILYQGATSDSLRLSYREFTQDDYARPAFTEEISLPLTREFPQMVAVKNLVLRLHRIDGLGISYEIVQRGPAPEPQVPVVEPAGQVSAP